MLDVIAEAGSNHNGNLADAVELVRIAKRADASCVKFQFIFPDELYLKFDKQSESAVSRVYQQRLDEQLEREEWQQVWDEAHSLDIEITASVFGEKSIKLLKVLGAKRVKIASSDANNFVLIQQALDEFDNAIISTGMSSMEELQKLAEMVYKQNAEQRVVLLHCVSLYPCPVEATSLGYVKTISDITGLKVGFSDHTACYTAAAAAHGMGCRVFEKHFTSSRKLPGFDHAHALEEAELLEYNAVLNNLQISASANFRLEAAKLGRNDAVTALRARRGVYAARAISAGEVLDESNTKLVRPQASIPADGYSEILGHRVAVDIAEEQPLDVKHAIGLGDSVETAANSYWAQEMDEKGLKT